MALEATIKIFEPVRVPVNHPLFSERDPVARAAVMPATWVLSNPADGTPEWVLSKPTCIAPACFASAEAASAEAASAESAPAGPNPLPGPDRVLSNLPSVAPAAAVPVGPLPSPVDPLVDARRAAAYYKSMHQRSVARVHALQDQLRQAETRRRDKDALRIAELEHDLALAHARIRQLEQQAFGRKTESSSSSTTDKMPIPTDSPPPAKRVRGQQPDKPRPKRRDHSALPCEEEFLDLPQEQRCCSACGLAFAPFPGTEDSEILEITVHAHRRIIRRRRYRPACSCGKHQGIIAAPPAPRVIPKSNLGVSIWVEVLLNKFRSYNPTHRLLDNWRTLELSLPAGTVAGGLKKMVPLFKPIYESLKEHLRKQDHWHGDETRWYVFAKKEGKVGHRWMLWVIHSRESAVYVLDPTRAHEVPEEALGPKAQGVMTVDRYSAYKAMKQVKEGKIVLAFCWAHVRRDFLDVVRSWREHQEWGFAWVKRIGLLYRSNKERVQALSQPSLFKVKDEQLREHIKEMAEQRDKELADPGIHEVRRKVLESLNEHWDGLTVFLDKPSVPLDNNQAERDLRGPVVGRKNYYGSGAQWAGELAAMLFSVVETLELWNINPRTWLTEYLQQCARAGGKAPEDHQPFLPWNMSPERKKAWSLKVEKTPEDSS
jgi:transposase